MPQSNSDQQSRFPFLPWILVGLLAGPAIFIPLLPPEQRPWNFAAFGAMAIFLVARSGRFAVPAAIAAVFAAKLISDLLNYRLQGFDPDYLPTPSIYLCLAGYAVVGWLILRNRQHPLRIGSAALLGSLQFFLLTNLLAWWQLPQYYERSLAGLVESYVQALPFYRGTLISDVGYTVLLFSAQAAWVWAAERSSIKPKLARISHSERKES